MLKIKLVRRGQRNQPHYRIVVQEARTKRDGKYAALLGHYAPTQSPKLLELDLDAYKEWVAKGAQPTETVASLAKRYESGNPFPPKKARPSKKQLAKEAAAKAEKEAPQEEAPVEEVAPAEEAESSEAPVEEKTESAEAPAETEAEAQKEEAPAAEAEEAKTESVEKAEEAK